MALEQMPSRRIKHRPFVRVLMANPPLEVDVELLIMG
jgi:hypothetical protein